MERLSSPDTWGAEDDSSLQDCRVDESLTLVSSEGVYYLIYGML